ncbi:hypothetical protein UT300009_33450 [Paraclostridium bifermentans]|uniref:radical SAM protein n=1 Tax=Paraclostridium bifermentans TaxID=1490 RepID=UPI003C3279E6
MDLKKKMLIDKKDIIIKIKNNKGYIYNKFNKKYIILNAEIINYLIDGSKSNITFLEFINAFQDDDKGYIINLLEILIGMDLFKEKDIENKKVIKSIHIALTYKCNLECKHCCIECSPRKETNLFLEDWKNIINKISDLKPEQLVFSGGEPLILDYFEELVKYSYKKLPETNFILSTNGTLIDKYDINFFKNYFNKIDISLDGYNKETADRVRGIGIFDKVMENIKLLKKESFNNINLSLTQGDLNIENREKFKLLCDRLGVTNTIRTFSPEGRGKDNSDLFLSKDKALPLSIIQMFEQASSMCTQNEKGNLSAVACDAGESQIFIDDRANVYPCPSLSMYKFKITNMQNEKCIDEVLAFKGGYNLYESMINKNESCKNCDLNIFCWYCPANFETAYNNNELEYWCDNTKENLDKIIWNEV